MAYKDRNEEHPFKTFAKMTAEAERTGSYPRVILLCGKEDFLVRWAESDLKSRLINPVTAALDCSIFNEDNQNAYDIISACETLPMMSARKLVIVEDSDAFYAARPTDMDADGVTALCEYIPNIPETTLLLIVSAKVDKRKAIVKSIAKTGLIYDFSPLDDSSLTAWMQKRLALAGRSASKSDMLRFAKRNGYGDKERSYNLFNLENDLKKIFALSQNTYITEDDFLAAGDGEPETAAFLLLDAAFSGRKGYALTILHNSIEAETPSKETGIILSFLGLICSQLEIMLEAKERAGEGQSQKEIEAEMGINSYRLQKAQQASSSRSVEQLSKNLFDAFQIEKNMKQGLLDPRLDLELFIAGL